MLTKVKTFLGFRDYKREYEELLKSLAQKTVLLTRNEIEVQHTSLMYLNNIMDAHNSDLFHIRVNYNGLMSVKMDRKAEVK